MDNVIKAYFYSGNIARTNTVFQYNRGMILKFMDVDLPATYRVDFSNSLTGQSKTCVGTADGVIVPLEMMAKGCTVYAWAVIANENSTVTVYQAMIPISPRAEPTDEAPNPEQQQVIDQLIAAMNQAVEQTGADVESANVAAAAAADSADVAAAHEAAAAASEQAAAASETAAAGSASSAFADAATAASAASAATQQAGIATSGAETATQKAADAAASEQAAASSEIAAAGSAAAAATSETNAGAAETAAQTAQAAAEAAAQSVSESAAQIETNKEDIAELKSAIVQERDGISLLASRNIIQGSYNAQGGVTTNSARIRNSGFIQVFKGQKIHFVPGETITQFLYGTFNTEKVFVSDSAWTSGAADIDINNDGYIIAVFANTAKTNITPDDYDAEFGILAKWRAEDQSISNDITSVNDEIGNFIKKYYKANSVDQIPNVTKLAGYSFGPSGTKVSGSVSSSYDSYYFYADADTALYFDNVAPSSPAYIAITVGYDPTKNWTGSSGGTLQMACSSVIRKRNSESNLPVSSEPLDVGGAIVIFTVNASTTTNVYINNGLELQDEVRLNQAQIDQVIESIPEGGKSPKLIYTTTQEFEYEKSTAQINIYLPTKYGYIRYAFGHSVDANINADSWRIFRAIAVDENLVDRFRITAYGEWEMALRLDGGTDFIGGVLHGDEVMEDVTFFLDGKETDISTLTSLTGFTELRIVENTLLYNPDVANENVAAHSKEYIFTADGVTINQRVKWLMAKTLTTSYSCMFPLIRGNDTVSELQITADYYDDNDYKTYDVSVGGMSGYPFTWHSGVTRANLWAEESGIFASAEIVKQPPAITGGGMSFLQNTVNQYNKLYFSICGIGATYTTSANETWRWSQRYTISAVEIN